MTESFDLTPLSHVSLVEFPFCVNNAENGVDCIIGGRDSLVKAIASKGKDHIQLRLRRKDPFHHPVRSSTSTSRQILLEVKIPKKGNGNGGGGTPVCKKDIMSALATSRCIVKPHAIIDVSLRFRDMADFQFNTMNNEWISEFKKSVLAGDLNEIMKLKIAKPVGSTLYNDLMIPPPEFSGIVVPFKYNYKDIKSTPMHSTATTTILSRNPIRTYAQNISWSSSSSIPKAPSENLEPIESLSKPVKDCIIHIKELFKQRPCWLRNGIKSHTPLHLQPVIKVALPYVCYTFRSGPWRNTSLLFGTDPASDRKLFAPLQTESFRVKEGEEEDEGEEDDDDEEEEEGEEETRDYQFDGFHLPKSRQFQLCDIREPNVVKILENIKLTTECHALDGWIQDKYIRAIRDIVRIRLEALMEKKKNNNQQQEEEINQIMKKLNITTIQR